MEPFYLSHEEFWEWFDRDPTIDQQIISRLNSMMGSNKFMFDRQTISDNSGAQKSYRSNQFNEEKPGLKRMKAECNIAKPIRHIAETEASIRCDARYVIMYGKYRPGKKSKVWEGDGYLSLVNGVAHISDLRGKMLEDPTILDDVDMNLVKDLGELLIGNTEVQIVEQDK